MILDDEDFEAKKFNSYWAGRLIDLPKDDAWEIAGEIAEAIEYALRQANGVYMSSEALPIADVVGRSEQLVCDCSKHATYFDEEKKPRCKNCNERSWLAR